MRYIVEKNYTEFISLKGERVRSKSELLISDHLNRFNVATLVEIHLITGRTHQIRDHMASIGHPVYNDTLYGFGKMKIKTEEQVLESYKLTFPCPANSQRISLEIEPNEKFTKVLRALEI